MSNYVFSDYDLWKTTPDDFYDPVDEDPCDHGEYDVDWEGRATCARCRESWWLTPEQHAAYIDAETQWHEEFDRRMRLESAWWYRAWRWLKSLMPRLRYRIKPGQQPDDEIPF
jgi:hypothetical protein